MRNVRFAVAACSLTLAIFMLVPSAFAADDGAGLYKTKCSACHGANGEGKPAVKAPSLVSDEAKKMSDDDLKDMIANGGKDKKATHAFSKKGLTDEQISQLISHIRELQKK